MFEKDLTKPEKNKIPKFPEAHCRKQEKQPRILKTMIFDMIDSFHYSSTKPKA